MSRQSTAPSPTPATPRGFTTSLVDSAITYMFCLPPQTCNYTIQNVRIPVPEEPGAELVADVYQPIGTKKPAGTIVALGPYGRSYFMSIPYAQMFACRGYQAILASTRGSFGSSGTFDPGRTEAEDARAVVAWMRKQDWYSGSFATVGASFLGFTQWALLDTPEFWGKSGQGGGLEAKMKAPDFKACAMSVGPHDFSQHYWGCGAFNMDLIEWADGPIIRNDVSFLGAIWSTIMAKKRIDPVLNAVPLLPAVERHFAGRHDWLRNRLMERDMECDVWKPMNHTAALEKANIPVLLVTGWYDLFMGQTMQQYHALRKRKVEVNLVVGPWNHFGTTNGGMLGRILQFIDVHFSHPRAPDGGNTDRLYIKPVRIYVTGQEKWREMEDWPPETKPLDVFLHPNRKISFSPPPGEEETGEPSSFVYDPRDPTPTLGGSVLRSGGRVDDTLLSRRADVLTFTSSPLETDIEILGPPLVELAHSASSPHGDLFVRLSEVDVSGKSHNVTETYLRLDPDREAAAGPLKLRLLDCAHRFKKGTSIRLLLAGGSHPRYARNLGTGEHPSTGSEMRAVTHTVGHSAGWVSRIELPIAVGAGV